MELFEVIRGTIDSKKYINMLEKRIMPFKEENMHFQHDNAPPHKAKITQEVLMNSKISVLEWRLFSPDINPIENIWWIFKQKVQQCNSTTLEELQVAIMDIWQNDASLNEACKAVIDSMPRRIRALERSRGGFIKY